jgi:hypothetical protein
LAVYVSSLMAKTPFPTAMIWGGAPYLGLLLSFATRFGPPGIPASQLYCSITTVILLYLGKAATAIGKTAEPSFGDSGRQHHAVHFALAFFVLSELAYHRQYFAYRGIENFLTSSWGSLISDADPTFNVSRTAMAYWYNQRLDQRTEGEIEGKPFPTLYFLCRVLLPDSVPFALVTGCFNYGIMRMVNQNRARDCEVVCPIAHVNVFFNTKNVFITLLNLWFLSRVVRQAGYIVIWIFLRTSAKALDWWNNNVTSLSYNRHQSSQDLETCSQSFAAEKI